MKPMEVRTFEDWLLDTGFHRVGARSDAIDGSRYVYLEHPVAPSPLAELQIRGDRGEWTVGLRFGGMRWYYDPIAWASCLDGGAIEEADLADQFEFIRQGLDVMRDLATYEDSEQRLREISLRELALKEKFTEPEPNTIISDAGYKIVVRQAEVHYVEGRHDFVVASELSHDNILTLHGFGEHHHLDFHEQQRIISNIRRAFHFAGFDFEIF